MRFNRLRHRLRRAFAKPEPLTQEPDFFAWEKNIAALSAERDLVTHEHHIPNDYYGHAALLNLAEEGLIKKDKAEKFIAVS